MICPKCKRAYLRISQPSEPDKHGFVAHVIHTTKQVKTPFGKFERADDICWLTQDEYDRLTKKGEPNG